MPKYLVKKEYAGYKVGDHVSMREAQGAGRVAIGLLEKMPEEKPEAEPKKAAKGEKA